MSVKSNNQNCPSCGAPVVSEICAYCGNATGLNTADADMEYPVLECKEVTLNFWTRDFPMIFAAAFGIPGLILLIIYAAVFRNPIILLLGIPFTLGGVTAALIVLRTILRYFKIKSQGKIIQGTVYGYMDDNFRINGQPTQIIKLLVETQRGPRFILYQLGSTHKQYGINDKVDLLVYKNYFMINTDKEKPTW